MNTYDSLTMDKLTELLIERAMVLGASGFSINNEIIPLSVALDACGPVAWALVLHADSMTRIAGIAPPGTTNVLPLTCVLNHEAPFANEAVTQPGILPMSVTVNLLDAALEHAICKGMLDLNYSPSEWMALPENQRIPPLEPYLIDLEQAWITEVTDNVEPSALINAWPQLYDHERLEAHMSNRGSLSTGSSALNFPSIR